MGIVLGVDVGATATKTVGFRGGVFIGGEQIYAGDPISSVHGAVGSFLHKHSEHLRDVSSIVLTGVGASFFDGRVYDVDTYKVEEFLAIGRGGLHLSGLSEAFVISMGTGTAFVRAAGSSVAHIGGTGVGGGTLLGLASKMLNNYDMESVLALAEKGRLENVDLLVRDILSNEVPSLPPDLTASNFGKIKSTASEPDLALGIINMIFETVGMMAAFAARNDSINNIVLTGALPTLPQAGRVFSGIGRMCGLNFIIPPDAVLASAMGAVLHYV